MSKLPVKLYRLKPEPPSQLSHSNATPAYWHGRIWAELDFAYALSEQNGKKWHALIEEAADIVLKALSKEGCLPPETARAAEERIAPIHAEAKEYEVICPGHAHIDMNWQWGFDETVAVTLDTFRTVLDLMDEYNDFHFSQSQASVYKIVEDYGTRAMLDDIKKRVHEGRWEVTASTWVEADKNMPSGESMARHQLYTRRYLSKLLDIPVESMDIDFEPDTFGHSLHVPELLSAANVKYYYHNRGANGPLLSRWRAPSGAEVLVYRDPSWYNSIAAFDFAENLMKLCEQTGQKTMLKIFGVGDHGGGPTRRDIERITDMQAWPVFPSLRFGTFGEFFRRMEAVRESLPITETEKNAVFTGCYTTQTEIKRANRMSELVLGESEAMSAFASLLAGTEYPSFEGSWQKTLFTQFHDILTGSCVPAAREYAMGCFSEVMAMANTQRSNAMREIAAFIDTSQYITAPSPDDTSGGAGVGSGVSSFKVTQAGRSLGLPRILHIFNPAPFEREEAFPVMVWDWAEKNIPLMEFRDSGDRVVPHQIMSAGIHKYWSHSYVSAMVKAKVPAVGWATMTLRETENDLKLSPIDSSFDPLGRVDSEDAFVLENECIRVELDTADGSIRSFSDKSSGTELADPSRKGGLFRLIHEDTDKGMAAWWVGRYMEAHPLHRKVRIKWLNKADKSSPLRRAISLEHTFGASKLKTVVSLDEGSRILRYDVECDWQETGTSGTTMPQLNFLMPLGYACSRYQYDIPFGVISRPAQDMDQPALSFIAGETENTGLMLWADSKHGFRGFDNALAATLIRGAYSPDPYPETGIHHFSLCLAPTATGDNKRLLDLAHSLAHPFSILFDRAHRGTLPLRGGLMELTGGSAALSGVKMPEDGSGMIVRLYETDGHACTAKLRFIRAPIGAQRLDILENKIGGTVAVSGDTVTVELRPYAVITIKVEF